MTGTIQARHVVRYALTYGVNRDVADIHAWEVREFGGPHILRVFVDAKDASVIRIEEERMGAWERVLYRRGEGSLRARVTVSGVYDAPFETAP